MNNFSIDDIINSVKPELKTVKDASIDGKIKELQKKRPGAFAPQSSKKAYQAKINGLNKLKQKIDVTKLKDLDAVEQIFSSTDLSKIGPKIEEDGEGAISTGNIGSPTITTDTGETKVAPFGSSAYYAPKVLPMVSRKGDIKTTKKKKKIREFLEFYNEDDRDHILNVEREVKKARKENNAEKVVYYSQLGNTSASASFEIFKGSWAYEQWKKKNQELIQKEIQELKRFSYMR